MELNDWYRSGITPDDYIESMQAHKESLLHIYDHFQLPSDKKFFETLKEKKLRALVLTEDWCGDAMLNIPILLRIAEAADIDVRMLLRDQNLELMDKYLTNGKSRSIPIFIFLDQNGEEVTKWGPRAKNIQDFIDNCKAELPSEESDDFKDKFKEMLFFITKSFRDNTDFWEDVYISLKNELNTEG